MSNTSYSVEYYLESILDSTYELQETEEFLDLCDSALSRTGYIITYCGCPIHWASRLQT